MPLSYDTGQGLTVMVVGIHWRKDMLILLIIMDTSTNFPLYKSKLMSFAQFTLNDINWIYFPPIYEPIHMP